MTSVRADGQPQGSPSTDESADTPARRPKRARARELGALALIAVVLLCGITLIFGFLNKDRCTGPVYDSLGRTEQFLKRAYQDVCYSDIQYLWVGRDIDQHVFPYVDGGITKDGQLTGGTVEYPVLTGLLMWLGAYFAHNDHEFLIYSALLLTPLDRKSVV